MSVSDGENASASNFNSSFMDREIDTDTVGVVGLLNTDTASGTTITNLQRQLNSTASFLGAAVNQAKDVTPSWASNVIGTSADNIFERLEAVQAQVESNTTNKIDKVSSTDNAIVRYDGTSGDVQNSGVTIDDSDNVIIPGDLTVQGTTTTIDTATLDVTDANITVNDGGNQATANSNVAGVTVEMSDATDARIGYDSSTTSKFKCGESGSEVEIATISGAQVITNKDIDGGTANNTSRIALPKDTTANLDLLTDKEALIAYDTTLGEPVYNNGSGWEQITGTGSGQGGINYIINTDFEDDVSNVTTSTNVTEAAETTNFLRGAQSLSLTISTSATTADTADIAMNDIDPQDLGKALYISFEYATDANYTTDDVEFVLRNTDSSVDIPIYNNSDGKLEGTGGLSNKAKFTGIAIADTTDNSYSLRMNVLSAPSSNSEIVIDNVIVGPEVLIPGYFFQDAMAIYTTNSESIANNTATTINFEDVIYDGDGLVTTGAGTWVFTAPVDGRYLVTCNIQFGDASWAVGNFARIDTERNGSAVQRLDYYEVESAATTIVQLSGSNVVTASAGDTLSVKLLYNRTAGALAFNASGSNNQVSITRLPDNDGALLSTYEASLQSIYASYYVSASTANSSFAHNTFETVDFDTEIVDTHNAVTTGASWVFTAPRAGRYHVNVAVQWNSSTNLTETAAQILVNGGDSRIVINSDSVATSIGSGDTYVNLSAGDTVEAQFRQLDSGTAARTIAQNINGAYINIRSVEDFNSFSAFAVSDLTENTSSTISFPITASQWGDLTSISLDKGEYDIFASATFRSNGSTTTGDIQLGVSTTSGNDGTGLTFGDNRTIMQMDNTNGNYSPLTVPFYNVTVTSPTTYYLKGRAETSITNLEVAYKISARRIR